MNFSPEIQAQIDQKANAIHRTGPSFPMPRLTHNGETGEWFVREVEGDKLAEEKTAFVREDGGKWSGIVLRVAWMSQSKYKENSPFQKMTREFTDFKDEPIELMKRTFGPDGRTESVKTYPNYQAFKAASIPKDEDGNPGVSAYDLKVCLYIYHLGRKQVLRLVVGGSGRSEWFEYARNRASGDEGVMSVPWTLNQPTARLLEQVKTEFISTATKTDKGMAYHRLSFRAVSLCTEQELVEIWAMQDKLNEWVAGWEAVNASKMVVPSDGLVLGTAATEEIPF